VIFVFKTSSDNETPMEARNHSIGVEESADLEDSECGADGQSADDRRTDESPALKPRASQATRTYAKVAKNRVATEPHVRFRPGCKRRKILSPLTLKQ
jgi:hypothetical protein